MNGFRLMLIGLVLAGGAVPAHAGIFFNRKPKPTPSPAERVPQLIMMLRSETDEHKRASAAEELRNFDAAAYPELVPVLVDAAMKDPESSVRLQAVTSLAKVRPISQRAGWALEQVISNDSSLRVQLQARSSLLQYRLHGYHSGEMPPGPPVKTEEPPLAPPLHPERLQMRSMPPTAGPSQSGELSPASRLEPPPPPLISSDGPELVAPK